MDRCWVPGLTSGYEHTFVHAIADFLRGIETDQHLAGLHDVAVLHAQLVDDAAFEVLHGLAVALDADEARRNRRAGERGKGRPAAKAQTKHEKDQEASEDGGTNRRASRHVAERPVAAGRRRFTRSGRRS
jgi:hypothetical protein